MKILDVILPVVALILFIAVIVVQAGEAAVLVDKFGNLF